MATAAALIVPKVADSLRNLVSRSSYAHFKQYLQLSNQLSISVHDKSFKFYKLTFTGCGSARISNQSCWQEAILTATLGTYSQLRTAYLSLIPQSPRFNVSTRAPLQACHQLAQATVDDRHVKDMGDEWD